MAPRAGGGAGRAALAAAALATARGATRVGADRRVIWRLTGRPVGSLCVFRRVTGVPCPGCGMTRSVALLSHGHPLRATRRNPLIWMLALLLARPDALDAAMRALRNQVSR